MRQNASSGTIRHSWLIHVLTVLGPQLPRTDWRIIGSQKDFLSKASATVKRQKTEKNSPLENQQGVSEHAGKHRLQACLRFFEERVSFDPCILGHSRSECHRRHLLLLKDEL
jgi:hypothetical protein